MKKKVFTLFLVLVIFVTVPVGTFAGNIWFSGWMTGSGKQHLIYEDRSSASAIRELVNSPLGWGIALRFLFGPTIENLILIPKTWEIKSQEVKMMKIQVEKIKSLSEIEIEKAKRELEFLYSPGDNWQQTPRGKQFLTNLSTQLHRPPSTPVYYFDTGN